MTRTSGNNTTNVQKITRKKQADLCVRLKPTLNDQYADDLRYPKLNDQFETDRLLKVNEANGTMSLVCCHHQRSSIETRLFFGGRKINTI